MFQSKTIIEPFKIKMVEPIKMLTRDQRVQKLEKAKYNPFLLKAEDVMIDLLTDSGTSAMSAAQWSALMNGDESYAGCRSYYDFAHALRELTGFKHIFPTHQGRAAERILFNIVGGEGVIIPNNTHFDTTRANVENSKAKAVDLVISEGKDPDSEHPFKGNMDIEKLEHLLETEGEKVPLVMLTVTNNSGGGQPVSMKNIREVKRVCQKYHKPLFLDSCRFAENAYFIKLREEGYGTKSVKSIIQEMFSYVDGATMSAKKDALVNMGGFLAVNDDALAEEIKNIEILTEGFPTYGGLAGRDLAAMAQGLKEIVDEDYLKYRIASTTYLGKALLKIGIPIVKPVGGHAVYIDAGRMLSHIPKEAFPGQALNCALYIEGGIRAVEIGSLMFGENASMELVRLAIPRRVYTQSHIDYVIEVLEYVYQKREQISGIKIIKEPPFLRHFSAEMAPINE